MKHPQVKHAKELRGQLSFNDRVAVKITSGVGTMPTAYIFTVLALVSLPDILSQVDHNLAHDFPHWLISVSLVALVAWVAQTFLQLVLLPIIIVGQNVIQSQNDAKAEVDHNTLTYLATIQDEQLDILKYLKEKR